MMRFAVLGSGSAGNSALLECEGKRLLIDAGLSAKQLTLRLESIGICPDSIDAILLTHEHGDHIGGIDVFLKTRNIPIYTNPMTREAFEYRLKRCSPKWQLFESGQDFQIGTLKIQAIPILHDAADPVGFRIESAHHRLVYLSDVGFATSIVKKALRGVDLAFLEANYDDDLLIEDTKRPHGTKQRIMGRHGHLSNLQASDLLKEVACEKLQHLVLGHLSSDCNDADLALAAVREGLSERHLRPQIQCSGQFEPTEWIELFPPASASPMTDETALEQPEFLF